MNWTSNKKIVLILSSIIVLSTLPLNVNADPPQNTFGVFLIKTKQDWVLAGFNNDSSLDDRPVYNDFGITDFYMPIALKKEDVHNLLPEDVTNTIYNHNANFTERLQSISFEILESETYYVVVYHMNVRAGTDDFHIDFVPKIHGEEIKKYAWFNSSFSGKMNIQFNHSQVRSTQYNIPLLVALYDFDCGYDDIQIDGDDICFVDDTECNQLNHEIEYFMKGGGIIDALIWVNVTELSSSVDTNITMYFGNSTCSSQEHITDTWDSHYVMVNHLSGASNITCLDSTAYDNDIIDSGGTPDYQQFCQIGYGIYLDRTNSEYLITGDDSSLDIASDKITLEAWVDVEEHGTDQAGTIVARADSGINKRAYTLWYYDTTQDIMVGYIYELGTTTEYSRSGDKYTIGSWQHVAFTSPAGDNMVTSLYLNGVDVAPYDWVTSTADAIFDNNIGVAIGCMFTTGVPLNPYTGYVDEVRISDIDRSEDWLNTCYNNIINASDGGFYNLSSCYSNNLPTVTNPNPTNHSTGVSIALAQWCAYIADDWTSFNYTIECSNGDTTSANNATNGNKCLTLVSGLICNTNYTVWVNVTEWNYCPPDSSGGDCGEGRTVYYWFWFITEPCGNGTFPTLTLIVGDSRACPCCLIFCFAMENGTVFNMSYSYDNDTWIPTVNFNITTNYTLDNPLCFHWNNFSYIQFNSTVYFNASLDDNKGNVSYSEFYVNISNASVCLSGGIGGATGGRDIFGLIALFMIIGFIFIVIIKRRRDYDEYE